MKLTFKRGNGIRGWQDMYTRMHSSLPDGVEFDARQLPGSGGFELIGKGYGDMKIYGNGAIHTLSSVTLEDLLNASEEHEQT